jgi:hypothetical protein
MVSNAPSRIASIDNETDDVIIGESVGLDALVIADDGTAIAHTSDAVVKTITPHLTDTGSVGLQTQGVWLLERVWSGQMFVEEAYTITTDWDLAAAGLYPSGTYGRALITWDVVVSHNSFSGGTDLLPVGVVLSSVEQAYSHTLGVGATIHTRLDTATDLTTSVSVASPSLGVVRLSIPIEVTDDDVKWVVRARLTGYRREVYERFAIIG